MNKIKMIADSRKNILILIFEIIDAKHYRWIVLQTCVNQHVLTNAVHYRWIEFQNIIANIC